MITKIININKIETNNKTIENSEILIENDIIIKIANQITDQADTIIDANQAVLTPGFVDSHTHPIFINNRSNEFQQRCIGSTYEEIADNGGGILSSIKDLRNADEDSIFNYCLKNINIFLNNGTTTIEAKSGYGLTLEDELKSLRIIKRLNNETHLDIIPTFMGAHAFPPEYIDKKNDYVDIVCNEMIPEVAKEKLAEFCDVFCEEGYFTIEQTRKIFESALESNLKLKIHADEFVDTGAASLAVEMGAISADHLMVTGDRGKMNLANSNTIATILPGTTFFLGKATYASGRDLIDKGCEVAIASDFNAGSCTLQSMPDIMFLSMLYGGLTLYEAFEAATYNGAKAIDRHSRKGLIKEGYDADILFWDICSIDEIPYWFGGSSSRISKIMKSGKVLTV
jgi:imidazolonepropionase